MDDEGQKRVLLDADVELRLEFLVVFWVFPTFHCTFYMSDL